MELTWVLFMRVLGADERWSSKIVTSERWESGECVGRREGGSSWLAAWLPSLPLLPMAFSMMRSQWSHTEENLSVGWKGRGCILLAENAKHSPRLISYTIVKMMERWVTGAAVETGSNGRWFSSAARSFKASKQERKHLDLVVSFIWSTYVTPLKHMFFSRTLLRECFFLF